MSENPNQSFVSPNKLSRPEQADVASQAAVRMLIIGNALARAANALTPMLTGIVTAQALQYPVEPTQSPQSAATETPQPYAATPEYQAPASTTPGYDGDGFSPAANTAYLDAIATDVPQDAAPPTLSDEALALLEDARRQTEEAFGNPDNMAA